MLRRTDNNYNICIFTINECYAIDDDDESQAPGWYRKFLNSKCNNTLPYMESEPKPSAAVITRQKRQSLAVSITKARLKLIC